MVKAKCNKGSVSLNIEGDVREISADVCTIIHAIYNSIYEDSIIHATMFRDMVEDAVRDGTIIFKSTEHMKEDMNNGNN